MQPDVPLLLSTLPQLSTACFLIKFWATLPPGEQAYFGCLPAVFVAHIAWRWTAPRHYLAWRSLPVRASWRSQAAMNSSAVSATATTSP